MSEQRYREAADQAANAKDRLDDATRAALRGDAVAVRRALAEAADEIHRADTRMVGLAGPPARLDTSTRR